MARRSPLGPAGALLLEGIESDSNELDLGQHLRLIRIDGRNWEQMRGRFPQCWVSNRGLEWCLEYPADWSERVEDLLLLLRLFQSGSISALANSRFNTHGGPWAMVPYPIFASVNKGSPYTIGEAHLPQLRESLLELPNLPAWGSPWLRVARSSFLLGSSTEFNPQHAATNRWIIRRVLDFVVALEAVLVPEGDFVGQRLRGRAARLLDIPDRERGAFDKRLKCLYAIRSNLAHGALPKRGETKRLLAEMPVFEDEVRLLLCAALRTVPCGDNDRETFLRGLYDVDDKDIADDIRRRFARIKSADVRRQLIREIDP